MKFLTCTFMLVLCFSAAVLGQPGILQSGSPSGEVVCSGAPGAPITVTPTTVDATSARICWDPPADAVCVNVYQVQVGTDPPRNEPGPCATFTDLNSGSDYIVSVRSISAGGDASDPAEVTFTTATVVTPPSPEISPASPPVVVTPPSPEISPASPPVVVTPPSPEISPASPPVVVTPPSPEISPASPPVVVTPPSPEISPASPPVVVTPPSPENVNPRIPEVSPSPPKGPSCESATATAISDAKVEGCGSQAFASSSAIAQVICNADGTVDVTVTSNAEAQAALQKQNEACGSPKPDGGQACIDALTALVTASQSGCTSSGYINAYQKAKDACGSSFDTLVNGLKVCQSTPPPPSPPSPPPPTCSNATSTAIAEAKASGCQSQAYSKAQTKAEIICKADGTVDVQVSSEALANAEAALQQQASACGYQRPQDLEQTCIDALTNVVSQARIYGCDSSEYAIAQKSAKNICGSRYEALNSDLGLCEFSQAGTEIPTDASQSASTYILAAVVALFQVCMMV